VTDALLTVVARCGVRAVARDHGAVGALVYAGFWWEYATGVVGRSQEVLAAGFGLTVKAFRAQVAGLVQDGWVVVKGRGSGWKVELRVTQALLDVVARELHGARETAESGVFAGHAERGEKVENGTFSGEKVEIDRFISIPTHFGPGAVSACYVRVWVAAPNVISPGTDLASSITTNNNVVVVSSKTDTLVSVLLSETPRRSRHAKQADDGLMPTKSSDFRRLTMVRIAQDAYFETITGLHAAWNTALGSTYALNPWRYAAWRTALVEQAYSVEALTTAMPRVASDAWAKSNLSDPHNMFTGNASKIERFFAANAVITHDRFGRTFPTSGTTFEF